MIAQLLHARICHSTRVTNVYPIDTSTRSSLRLPSATGADAVGDILPSRGLIRCTVSRTFPGTRLGELRERLLIAPQARKATPGTINRPSPPLAFNNRNSRQFFPEPMVRVWVRVVRFSFDVAKGRVQASRFDEVRSCVQSQCIES